MKNLILSAAIAIAAMFIVAAPVPAQAGGFGIFCCKKKCSTVEVCRSYFCREARVCGCTKVINYIEVTYCTTYCDGSTKTWTKVYRT